MRKRTINKRNFLEFNHNRFHRTRIAEGDANKKTNYAIQVRNMRNAHIYLLTGTKSQCLKLEEILDSVLDQLEDMDDDELEDTLEWLYNDVFSEYGLVGKINFRNIDKNNNYYDYNDDRYYHIINDISYDLYDFM